MGLGCGSKLAKLFLIVFNIIFFLLGAVALALGIWVLVDKTHLITLTKMGNVDTYNVPGLLESGAYVLIGGGGFIFIVGFLGCCGAMKEVKVFLIIYAILVGIIFCVELAAGIVAYFYRDTLTTKLQTYLNDTIILKYEGRWDTNEPFSLAWDFVHVTFSCCGFNNYTDFDGAQKWNTSLTVSGTTYTMVAPPSCCIMKDKTKYPSQPSAIELQDTMCPVNPTTANSYYNKGCYQSVIDTVMTYSGIVMGIGIAIAVIEIIGIIAACCLVKAISDQDKVSSA